MLVRYAGLGLSLGLVALSFAPIRLLAQPSQSRPAPIPTASPFLEPSAIPAEASPIPLPSTFLPPVPAVAPGFNAPALGTPDPSIAGVAKLPFVGMNLSDAVTMALMRNTDLAVSQSNRRLASYEIVAAHGPYDIQFQVVPSYEHSVQPPTSLFVAGPAGGPFTTDTLGATASIGGQTLGGTRYNVSATAARNTTNLTTASFNPNYPTALSFNLTQPLARGLKIDNARRQLELANINADAQTDAALVDASQVITSVADAYWDLVAAWRNVAIQEDGLRTAQAQAASNQRLVQQGQAAPVDVVESNDQVNVFQDNVFSALQSVQRLQTQLKGLILANPADPLWMANLVPTSSVTQLPAEPTVDAVMINALGHRPEIAQLRESRRNAGVNVAYAKDQLKPQLDLGVGYTTNGYAGSPINPETSPVTALFINEIQAINQLIAVTNKTLPPGQQLSPLAPLNFNSPAFITGGIGTSYNNLFNNKFPAYQAQLTIGLPLRNSAATGNYDAALEQARQVELNQIALIQRLKLESANAVQGLRSARSRLIAATSAREAAEQVYASEVRKYRAGTSTTFLVLQRQLNLANDRGRELQAQTDLNKALVELDRVQGGLFSDYNLDIEKLGAPTLMLTGSSVPGPVSGGAPPSPPASPAPSQALPPPIKP